MLGRSTKARLQARLNNDLESRLKLIYKNILMKSKEPGALLQDIRDITNDTDANLIEKANPKLLQAVSASYLDLLRDNRQFVNKLDYQVFPKMCNFISIMS